MLIMFVAFRPDWAGQSLNRDVELYLRQGIESVQRNNLSQAEKFLKIALERQRSAVAYYWLGVTYMKEHQPAETENALLKAIELRPNFPKRKIRSVFFMMGRSDIRNRNPHFFVLSL